MKIIGAATIGAFAQWLFGGLYTIKSFVQMLGIALIGGAAAVAVLYFIPVLREAPEFVQWAIAGIVGSSSRSFIKRIETFNASLKIGGVKIETNGETKDKNHE